MPTPSARSTRMTWASPSTVISDEPDLEAIRAVGKPFWLAGGYDSHDRLEQALAAGATGVQFGSVFALAEESGMRHEYRSAILNEIKRARPMQRWCGPPFSRRPGFHSKWSSSGGPSQNQKSSRAGTGSAISGCCSSWDSASRTRTGRASFSSAARPAPSELRE